MSAIETFCRVITKLKIINITTLGTAIKFNHFTYLKPKTAVNTIIMPQNKEDAFTEKLISKTSNNTFEKDIPAIFACIPNHTIDAVPIMSPTIIFEPEDPKERSANCTAFKRYLTALTLKSDRKINTKEYPKIDTTMASIIVSDCIK